ncbi:MAG: hypothetical protein Q7T10_11595 [Rhodoferax sp.]|uniref:hypothetical protein n=1 Tax=Rhodoferax sp. TaxID=50421 RepID=UPI0027286C27|nr:hypothetical protein [Rhodoferax sp.]MDO8449435.1 hypothetical protein [Rhodoferax sp.]
MIAAAGLALGLAATGVAAAEKDAHKHGADSVKLTLDNGKKWATDEALRKGMGNIRTEMQASLHEIHEGKLTAAKYNELAKKVGTEVGGIVAECKLEPKADAQLHLVVAEMLEGIEAMEGKSAKVKRRTGAVKVLAALDKYGAHFDHPNWQPIKE